MQDLTGKLMTSISVIQIAGPDSQSFLQGQLTCNINDVTTEQGLLAAHCNDKGRVISLFYIFLDDDKYYLTMPTDLIPIALQHLKKYAIFSKVTIEEYKNITSLSFPDNIQRQFSDYATWQWQTIQQGIPTIYAATSSLFLPHDLNLPTLGAINFKKGCYLGQEIIARLEFRGKPKRHLETLLLELDHCPSPGTEIAEGQIVDAMQDDDTIYATVVTTINIIGG